MVSQKKPDRTVPIVIGIVVVIVIVIALIICAPFSKANPVAGSQTLDEVGASGLQVGDTVQFGAYQDAPLEWQVLAAYGGKVLLITQDVIDTMRYNSPKHLTWETSQMREWLNDGFIKGFADEDRQRIAVAVLDNPDNPTYGTLGGNQTSDRVFLLSIDEADAYFLSDADRIATFGGAEHSWWLRSPGLLPDTAAIVNSTGSINPDGSYVAGKSGGVRPALWLDLSATG